MAIQIAKILRCFSKYDMWEKSDQKKDTFEYLEKKYEIFFVVILRPTLAQNSDVKPHPTTHLQQNKITTFRITQTLLL